MDETTKKFIELAKNRIYVAMKTELRHEDKILFEATAYISNLLHIINSLEWGTLNSPELDPAIVAGTVKSKSATADRGDLEEELADSQKYLERYRDSSDEDYLRMAQEELGHANKFLSELQRSAPKSQRFNDAYHHYNKLKAEIESYS